MRQPAGQVYEFGSFRYDAGQRLLFRDGEVVPLVPKAVDTLHVLLERRGRVVDKDELMKLVWPDTVVEEVGLARNISLLRKALGADADNCIETIPKRGYRFVGVAQARRRWLWPAALATVAALAGLIYWQFYAPSRFLPGGGLASLVVLPLEPLSMDLAKAGFPRAFNELLVAELSRLGGVSVISPSTVQRYRWVGIGPQVMARVLAVDVILEGTAQRQGDQLRITTRLADVHSGKLIWAETYDQPAGDVVLAQTIASEVGKRLAKK